MKNEIQWQQPSGQFSSTPPAPSYDWRGEVAQNIRGSGFGNDPQAKVREASAMRPSPNNFSGGDSLLAGFGPNDPRNTDEYFRRVTREPFEVADANRARALQPPKPVDMSWEGTVARVSARNDARVQNAAKSPENLFAPRDDGAAPDAFREWLNQVKGGAPADGASSFDTSFQSILQLLED